MFDGFSEQYLRLIANFRILLFNPSECFAVDYLQFLALFLVSVVLLRMVFSTLICQLLKRRLTLYDQMGFPDLLATYRSAASDLGMDCPPPLYRFWNVRPPAFTMGILKPAIFLAPRLVEGLSRAELRAMLVHELVHAKRWDNLRSWTWEVFFAGIPALIIQFFALNFILSDLWSEFAIWGALISLVVFRWILWKPMRSFRERLCDDITVRALDDRLTLAQALISVWRLSHQWPRYKWRLSIASVQPFVVGTTELEARVRRLISDRELRRTIALARLVRVAMVLSVVLSTGFLLWFYSSAYPHRLPMGFDCLTIEQIFESGS